MNIIKKTITMGDGTIVEIETGKLAKQAAGSVVVKVGGMMLLATVTCAKDAKEDVDFMPLSVEYKEKYAAAGRYPGGFWWPVWWTGRCVRCFPMISTLRYLSM